MLERKGRPMQLRRNARGQQPQLTPLLGFAAYYAPGEIEGDIQQGDERVEIGADEVQQAGITALVGLWLLKDDKDTTIMGAVPHYDGAELVGYTLWVRGA